MTNRTDPTDPAVELAYRKVWEALSGLPGDQALQVASMTVVGILSACREVYGDALADEAERTFADEICKEARRIAHKPDEETKH